MPIEDDRPESYQKLLPSTAPDFLPLICSFAGHFPPDHWLRNQNKSAIEIFVYQNASSTFLSQFRVEEVSPAIAILVLHVVWFIVPLSGRSPVGTDISFRFRLLDIFRYFQYFLLDLGRTSAASSTSSAFSANQFHNWQFYSINCTLFSFAIQSITKCRSSFIVHRSSLIR